MAKAEGTYFRWRLGGMDERIAPERGTAERVTNMVYDPEGYWQTAPGILSLTRDVSQGGPPVYGPFAAGSGAIVSMCWFQPRPNQRFLVVERESTEITSTISNANVQNGSLTDIAEVKRLGSQDVGTQFVELGRWLYMFSPLNAPVRWDGHYLAPVGFSGAGASLYAEGSDQGYDLFDHARGSYPSTWAHQTRQRGVGEFPSSDTAYWRYGYAMTEVNDLGQESPPTPIVWATGNNPVTDGYRFARLRKERSADNIVACRIWRTRNLHGSTESAGLLYLHSEWLTGAPFDLLDHLSDGELTLPLDPDQFGPMPTGARAVAFWQNSLWLGGMADYPAQIRYSVAGLIEQMPEIRRIMVGTDRTGPIVAMRAIPRGLVVFKASGVYMVIGSEIEGYRVETVAEGVGCAAPRAIELVPGVGLLFLDSSGPQVLVGALNDSGPTEVRSLVGLIRKTWRRAVGRLLQSAVSVYDPEHEEVWFHVPEGGNVKPSIGLVLHTTLGQWSIRNGYKIGCFYRYRDAVWVGSWDDTDETVAGVHVLTYASQDAWGETVNSRYRTNYVVFDTHVSVQRIEIGLVALGGSAIGIEAAVDRGEIAPQSDNDRPAKHATYEKEVWGTALWGSAYSWTEYRQARVAVSLHRVAGQEVQFRLSSERMRIHQLSLLLPPGTGTISPLTPERRPA